MWLVIIVMFLIFHKWGFLMISEDDCGLDVTTCIINGSSAIFGDFSVQRSNLSCK